MRRNGAAWFAVVFALMQFFFSPCARRFVGQIWPTAGDPAFESRAWSRLHRDGARAIRSAGFSLVAIISGITTSSIPTAMAYIADVTPKEKRAGAFGMIGVAFGIGFAFGPALGGLLGNFNPRLAFWVAARIKPGELALGLFLRAGIARHGAAKRIRVATRQPGRLAHAPALASRTLAS